MPISYRARRFCPSCHETRALEKDRWVAEHVCVEVFHRVTVLRNRRSVVEVPRKAVLVRPLVASFREELAA